MVGSTSTPEMLRQLLLTPIVAVLAVGTAAFFKPKLHGQSVLQFLWFSLRMATIVVSGILVAVFTGDYGGISRDHLAVYGALFCLVLFFNRLFLSWYYLKGRQEHESNFLKVLVVGSGPRARKLVDEYTQESDWGIRIVAMLDPEPIDAPDIGDLSNISEILQEQVVDEVIICTPRSFADQISRVAELCEEHGVCLKYMADLYDIKSKQVSLEYVGQIPVLAFEPVAQEENKLILKRVIDLILVLGALPLLLPLFALLAIAIKIESSGPVFFLQSRVGLNKRQFKMIKFRSMYSNAEARLADIEHLNEAQGPIFKMKDDPRVTKIGRFIRRASIDELPQLFNVLVGHMSLIGPRPMSLRDVGQFSLGVQRKRFSVKPGLACLREISGRSALSFEEWLKLDLFYIDNWSLSLDFKILLRLLPAVIAGEGTPDQTNRKEQLPRDGE